MSIYKHNIIDLFTVSRSNAQTVSVVIAHVQTLHIYITNLEQTIYTTKNVILFLCLWHC